MYYKIDEYNERVSSIDGVSLSILFNIFRVFSNNYLIIYKLYIEKEKEKYEIEGLEEILEYIKGFDIKIIKDNTDFTNLNILYDKLKELINLLPK